MKSHKEIAIQTYNAFFTQNDCGASSDGRIWGEYIKPEEHAAKIIKADREQLIERIEEELYNNWDFFAKDSIKKDALLKVFHVLKKVKEDITKEE